MVKKVLVAEDDPGDVFLLQRAFTIAEIPTTLHFVRDGQEAIDYLDGKKRYADRQAFPLPDLLLLDLKMPKLNGFDVLNWVRQQPGLKRLLITVLTSSDQPQDINRAYDLGANSYLVKPHATEDLVALVQRLGRYWVDVNKTPDWEAA